MQQLRMILVFYRPLFLWSFAVNILITILNPDFIPAVLTKLFLVILLWYIITETQAKQKLMFYKNLGISTVKLFSILYFIDIFITISFLLIVKVFI